MLKRDNIFFKDRTEAGFLLSQKLAKYKSKKNAIVLGIPRGGVVVAKAVSENLKLPLDIVVTKKIGAPNQEELAIGAVGPEGTIILDNKLIDTLGVKREYIEKMASQKSDEIVERLIKFGKTKDSKFKNKTIILIDDGIATGATVEVAVKYLKYKKANKIIIAVPIIPKSTVPKFKNMVDELIALKIPFVFDSVGRFYKDFSQVTDNEVSKIIKRNN